MSKLASINNLPPELLYRVFELLQHTHDWDLDDPTHRFPYVLANVCQYWDQVAGMGPANWWRILTVSLEDAAAVEKMRSYVSRVRRDVSALDAGLEIDIGRGQMDKDEILISCRGIANLVIEGAVSAIRGYQQHLTWVKIRPNSSEALHHFSLNCLIPETGIFPNLVEINVSCEAVGSMPVNVPLPRSDLLPPMSFPKLKCVDLGGPAFVQACRAPVWTDALRQAPRLNVFLAGRVREEHGGKDQPLTARELTSSLLHILSERPFSSLYLYDIDLPPPGPADLPINEHTSSGCPHDIEFNMVCPSLVNVLLPALRARGAAVHTIRFDSCSLDESPNSESTEVSSPLLPFPRCHHIYAARSTPGTLSAIIRAAHPIISTLEVYGDSTTCNDDVLSLLSQPQRGGEPYMKKVNCIRLKFLPNSKCPISFKAIQALVVYRLSLFGAKHGGQSLGSPFRLLIMDEHLDYSLEQRQWLDANVAGWNDL